ncbi:MAG: hypothetical protein JXQ72_06305, partial [Anaerolineae bacterium]|nr:hypothetical protein [Anaerolineae bacterium]
MPDPTPPPSALVVISWWSNCLALDCLQRLRTHAPDRPLYVVQVGKSPEQCARFREQVPPEVRELSYPDDAPAEHSRVIQHTAFTHLRDTGGVWFIDHDVLFQAEAEPFFAAADRWFARDPALCLCVNSQSGSPALTQPAFWLSPSRWPESTPALDPVPFKPRSSARRPDLYHHEGEMSIPEQDTLVRARDELAAAGRAAAYTLDGSDDSD